MPDGSPLEEELRRLIADKGPIPVADYMALCLSHPTRGYYATRDPLGRAGDFITAPEVSQMFGELIGLWAAAVWRMMGSPNALSLVELGPGRGTMMADALRAAKVTPAFATALSVFLVETSPVLRARQGEALANSTVPITWHDALSNVPHGPAIYLANEFFDALPVDQLMREAYGWHPRVVTIDAQGQFKLSTSDQPTDDWARIVPPRLHDAPIGSIFEHRLPNAVVELAERVARDGAALIIDYGHLRSALGDTWQAVARHGYADPLRQPGSADLTAHVDFEALTSAAATVGARPHGPIEQAVFLRRLGIAERAAALKSKATPAQASAIDTALARLTDESPRDMGRMFKVLGLAHPRLGALPGFDA